MESTTMVTVTKQNWSPAQILACAEYHGLAVDANLFPEHFVEAGIGAPDGGTTTDTIVEGTVVAD